MHERLADLLGAYGPVRYRIENPGQEPEEGTTHNIFTLEGLIYIWETALTGDQSPITAWYLGLKDNTGDPPVDSRTYATPGFVEYTGYDESERPLWDSQYVEETAGVISAHNDDGSPGHDSWATFTFNEAQTIYGAAQFGGGSAAATKGDTAGGGVLLRFFNFDGAKEMAAAGTLKVMADARLINTSPPA